MYRWRVYKVIKVLLRTATFCLEGFPGLQPRENNNFPELNKSIKSQEGHTIEGNHNAF